MIILSLFSVFIVGSRRILVFAVMCMLVVSIASSLPVFSYDFPVEAPPPWLRVGTYVEYDGMAYTFGMRGYEGPFVFRWECIALSGINATLNLTVTGHPAGNISVIVNIVTNTRDLLSPNGTMLGKAGLWLPPNLKKGDRIVVSGKPPSEVVAEVWESGGGSTLTCQGYQELYCIMDTADRFGFDGYYDVDTGLPIPGGSDDPLEFILPSTVLELSEKIGEESSSPLRFLKATNVDLGPRYLRTEILTFLWNTLPIWVPAIVFISVLVIMVRKRRKRRRLKQTKPHKPDSQDCKQKLEGGQTARITQKRSTFL
jgi:hypothetical protein